MAAVDPVTGQAAAPASIRVLLVDDDALVRSGLAMILGGAPDIEVVAQAVDGQDGLMAAREHRPDVVLMDIRMPRMDGLEATEHLQSWDAPPKVIVLTTFDADDYVVRALGAGASGFLLKDTPPPVDRRRDPPGGRRRPDAVPERDRPADRAAHRGRPRPTGRERPRSGCGCSPSASSRWRWRSGHGLTNAEIAAGLHLSVPTVKAHIGRLFTKLGADNRVQIAICVHDAGLA